ncbi:MAG: IclR family transcriptional regulator [Desulfuromonas sp.]|nr:MAG: IclR family transcriptional regulator [Desulfuromonas sp.]
MNTCFTMIAVDAIKRRGFLTRRQKESYSIQSVDNALDVLEALCDEGDEVRISQLSERLGMNKTSIFRLLATFENRGYVEKEQRSGKYKLGLSAYEIGQKFLSRMGLLRKAKPVMEKLARACNEAIYLAVPSDNEVLLLDMVDTTQQVKIIPLLGNRYPITGPSAGRAIVAFGETHQAKCSFEELAALEAELVRSREQGGCYDQGSFGEGIASLAVPLIDAEGNVPGSLCIVGPEFRLTPEKIEQELLPSLIEAGIVISSKLGYVGHFMNKDKI